jgi:acyl-CoA dehydrogenase
MTGASISDLPFQFDSKTNELHDRLTCFMQDHVYPAEQSYRESLENGGSRWQIPPVMEEMKKMARDAGLWNLFIPDQELGAGLDNLSYAPLAEQMGRSLIGAEVFNCNAPDSGNMEVLWRYSSEQQQQQWLQPLLAGNIRSAFCMTEPAVASSDATNIETTISRDGDQYVINGHKWWSSGALDPRCSIFIVMGISNPGNDRHHQHSMILVPANTSGVEIVRPLTVFGYDDAPHGHAEITFDNVTVPADNLILGEGRGFEIAQGRLGPGRIHHCMRMIGLAQRALESMCERAASRQAFGKSLSDMGGVRQVIARSAAEIEQARLLTLNAAAKIDQFGNKAARNHIAMIKIVAPAMAQRVLDRAIQVFGGAGVCQDHFLAHAWAAARSIRIADGPDEVHLAALGKWVIRENT